MRPGGGGASCPGLTSALGSLWGRVTSLPQIGCVLVTECGKNPREEEKPEAGRAGRDQHLTCGAKPGSGSTASSDTAPRRHHERPSRGPEPPAAGGPGQGEVLRGPRGLGRGRAARLTLPLGLEPLLSWGRGDPGERLCAAVYRTRDRGPSLGDPGGPIQPPTPAPSWPQSHGSGSRAEGGGCGWFPPASAQSTAANRLPDLPPRLQHLFGFSLWLSESPGPKLCGNCQCFHERGMGEFWVISRQPGRPQLGASWPWEREHIQVARGWKLWLQVEGKG